MTRLDLPYQLSQSHESVLESPSPWYFDARVIRCKFFLLTQEGHRLRYLIQPDIDAAILFRIKTPGITSGCFQADLALPGW